MSGIRTILRIDSRIMHIRASNMPELDHVAAVLLEAMSLVDSERGESKQNPPKS